MRTILIAGFIAAGTGVAHASSIEEFEPTDSARDSIMEIDCTKCEPVQQGVAEDARLMPPGTSIRELREVDGQMMVYTTQNWLGGSPVTIVRKATDSDLERFAAKRDTDGVSGPESNLAEVTIKPVTEPVLASVTGGVPTIDTEAKTSALPDPASFNPSQYELRLD